MWEVENENVAKKKMFVELLFIFLLSKLINVLQHMEIQTIFMDFYICQEQDARCLQEQQHKRMDMSAVKEVCSGKFPI